MQTTGSRAQVWHKTAKKTTGGLIRDQLFQDKYGNIKSKKASAKAKRIKKRIIFTSKKNRQRHRSRDTEKCR